MAHVPFEGVLLLAALLIVFYLVSLLAAWNLAQERERRAMRQWLQQARDEELDRLLRNVIRKSRGQREEPRSSSTYAYANVWGVNHPNDELELAAVASYLEAKENPKNEARSEETH